MKRINIIIAALALTIIVAAIALATAACSPVAPASETYTLYRSSAVPTVAEMHVATFNADEGAAYNRENCGVARDLFQGQLGVAVKYWCEQGSPRRSR